MFNSSEFKSRELSMDHFRGWANDVASQYLKEGTEPNTSITKIAQSEELTPSQIAIVATEANKLIHNTKYASEDVKYHAANFPLADSNEILRRVKIGGSVEKVANSTVLESTKDIDIYAIMAKQMNIVDEPMDKTASDNHQIKLSAQKLDAALTNLETENFEIQTKIASEQKSFIKQARQYMISEDHMEGRAKMLGILDHFVKCANVQSVGKPMLAKLACVLKGEGLIAPTVADKAVEYFMSKEADCKAPQELISEGLAGKVQVINGDNPLYITLQTIERGEADRLRNEQQYQLIKDKLKLLNQKVRAL